MNLNNNLNNKNNKILIGIAGEYLVAAELSKLGYIASITLRNTKGVDIVCFDSEVKRVIGIQVKTNQGLQKEWILNKKVEEFYSDNLFYVFVNLNNNERNPDFFIVPIKKVAEYCRIDHKKWLNTKVMRNQKHHDNPIRKFKDEKSKYLNRWDLLNLTNN